MPAVRGIAAAKSNNGHSLNGSVDDDALASRGPRALEHSASFFELNEVRTLVVRKGGEFVKSDSPLRCAKSVRSRRCPRPGCS